LGVRHATHGPGSTDRRCQVAVGCFVLSDFHHLQDIAVPCSRQRHIWLAVTALTHFVAVFSGQCRPSTCFLRRGACAELTRAEALETGFEWSILGALYRSRLGMPARLDRWRERELGGDVAFQPLPAAFVHAPFGSVMSQVQGEMRGMGVPLLPIDGLRGRGEESALFLQDVVSPPEPALGAPTGLGMSVSCLRRP
jgi:hypothetical protein